MHTSKPKRMRFFLRMAFVVMFMSYVVHGQSTTPGPTTAAVTPNPTTPEPTPEPTPAPVPAATPDPTAEPTPAPVPAATPDPTAEPTPAPVPAATPDPTAEPTPAPVSAATGTSPPTSAPTVSTGSSPPTSAPTMATGSSPPTVPPTMPPTRTSPPTGTSEPTGTPAPTGTMPPTGTPLPTDTLPPSDSPTEESSQPSTSPSTQPSTSPSTMPSPGPSTEEFIGLVEGAEMTLYGIDELEGESVAEWESQTAEFTDMFWSGNDGVDLITTAINVTGVSSNSRRLRGRFLEENATIENDDLSVTVTYSHGFIYETDSPQSIGPRLLASLPFSTSTSRGEYVLLLQQSGDPTLANVTDSSSVSIPAQPETNPNTTEAPSTVLEGLAEGSDAAGGQPTPPPIDGGVAALTPTQAPGSGAFGYCWSQRKVASLVGGVSAIVVLLL